MFDVTAEIGEVGNEYISHAIAFVAVDSIEEELLEVLLVSFIVEIVKNVEGFFLEQEYRD